MKKFLAIALGISVGINLLPSVSYAQDYVCNLEMDRDGLYYLCEPSSWGEYSCRSDEGGYECWYDVNEYVKSCRSANEDETSYLCNVGGYNKIPDVGWYYFEPKWSEGSWYCYYAWEGAESLNVNDLRNVSYYWDYACGAYWDSTDYYGCYYREGKYFCPQWYDYYIDRAKGKYVFYKASYWYDTCEPNGSAEENSVNSLDDTYTCWWLNNCYPDEVEPIAMEDDEMEEVYVCPISYRCNLESWICDQYESWGYHCESNGNQQAKSLLSNIVEYSCSDGEHTLTNCDWDDNQWRFECSRCLAEWAEYDEELEQCIYTTTGYDGKDIVIMSTNLWATQQNPIWLYYQWWKWYGFGSYFSYEGPEYNIQDPLTGDELALFQSYDLSALWNTRSAEEDPCPTWFHVPSMSEWNNLFISWCENDEECDTRYLTKSEYPENQRALNDPEWHGAYEDIVNRFVNDYSLRLLWSRDENEVNMFDMMWDYWSSERMLGNADVSYHGTGLSSWWLTLYPEWWVWPLWFFSDMAVSVRCFKDIEDEVSTPVALDLYIWWCSDSWHPEVSAIRNVEISVACSWGGYIWRKFVWSGEAVDVNNLVELPEWRQWSWYLDNDQDEKLTSNTFTEDTRLYVFEEEIPVTLMVTKVRDDGNNQDMLRPASVSVELYAYAFQMLLEANRELVTTVILSEDNNWTATVSNLPQYDNNDNLIEYMWIEEEVQWYESTQTWSDFITTITNKHTPAVVTQHTITFNPNGGSPVQSKNIVHGQPIPTPLPTSTRNGYTLDWWYIDEWLTEKYTNQPITDDMTLYAKWTENKPSWWNSGGYSGWGGHSKWNGWSSSDIKSVDEPSQGTTDGKEENKPGAKPVNNRWNAGTGKVNSNNEAFDAYQWAYANGLTKYGNMSDARLDDPLNRQEMAKISTIFAIKFATKTPDTNKRTACSQYSDLWKVTSDMEEFIIQSCELGYMWYRANGVDYLERFRPYTPVSVAEFSIILSRIVWWNRYAIDENHWYQWHMYAVYNNNLLDNITKPFDYITRREAYVMLYRLSKDI